MLWAGPIERQREGAESMKDYIKMPPDPTIDCPKDGEKVPVWYCLGSLTQGRERCPYLVKATLHGEEWAEIECKWKKAK